MTNGFDATVVLAELKRLGWVNPTHADYDIVSADNQESTSGRKFNDGSFHSSLTVENIHDCQDDETISDADFNAKLESMNEANMLAMLNAVFSNTQIIESGLVYKKLENTSPFTVSNDGKFAGIRICPAEGNPAKNEQYGVSLKNAILFFDQAKTFNLYLYNELADGSTTKHIQSWSVTTVANRQVVVPLNYDISNSSYKGGTWFLGYRQDDLGDAKALSYSPTRNIYKVFNALSFQADTVGADDFERSVYSTTSDMYGLNLEVSAYHDITNTIVLNAPLFDNLQGLMMAARVIELICNSTRTTGRERIGKENLSFLYRELNSVTTMENPYESGLKRQIQKEIANIKKALNPKPKSMTVQL